MQHEYVLLVTLLGLFLFSLAVFGHLYPGPGDLDRHGQTRKNVVPLFLAAVGIVGLVIWDRQGQINQICDGLRMALTFSPADAPMLSGKSLNRVQTTSLMTRLPGLLQATESCRVSASLPWNRFF